jgi:hypothetical protein
LPSREKINVPNTPRQVRHPHDVIRSKALVILMNKQDPAPDPAGWSVSDTGTVWTEIVAFPGTARERRTQVIAFSPCLLLLVIPLLDDPEFASTVEDFATLSGYDEPGDDPHVIATREARDAVRMAHAAAEDRLDGVLSDGPTLLTRETTALLSRRSLGRWADTRAADELTTAVRQIVAALSMGRAVRIEVI